MINTFWGIKLQKDTLIWTFYFRDRLNICGDIHGQFFDLMNIFEKVTGFPTPDNQYLFNGDFVDRGVWSVEVMIVLLGFKLLLPGK